MSAPSASSTKQGPDSKPETEPERGDDRASLDQGESGGGFFSGLREFFSADAGWGNKPPQKGDDSSNFDPGY